MSPLHTHTQNNWILISTWDCRINGKYRIFIHSFLMVILSNNHRNIPAKWYFVLKGCLFHVLLGLSDILMNPNLHFWSRSCLLTDYNVTFHYLDNFCILISWITYLHSSYLWGFYLLLLYNYFYFQVRASACFK